MTGTAYPGDAVAGVPTYTATQGRSAFAAAMGGATAARPLGGLTGIRPGTPSSILTIPTNTTWQLTPFGGYIDLESPGTTGGYFFSFQANETGSIAAAAGSIRSDLLYVQINDSNTGDGSGLAPRVVSGVQTGVAGAGIPTLTVARAFVLAVITVPASGGGSPTFTWVTPYTVAAGGILPVPAGTTPTSPYAGQYADDAAQGFERYTGAAWAPGWQAFKAELKYTGAGISCPTGTSTLVTWDASDYYNYLSAFTYNRAAGTFVCTRAGTYDFTASNAWPTSSGTGIRQLVCSKAVAATPTTFVAQPTMTLPGTTGTQLVTGEWRVTLAVGDVVEFTVAQSSGSTLVMPTANLTVSQVV